MNIYKGIKCTEKHNNLEKCIAKVATGNDAENIWTQVERLEKTDPLNN